MSDAMVLVLEDGFTVFGERGGQAVQASGEIVINTCMAGYQEVLSDPSYAGQMVVMTYPLIGNYGATPEFQESGRPWARALITRQLSTFHQHWRTQQSLTEWLDGYGVPILTGCDTRRLARHLRGTGAQRAIIGPRHERPALLERVHRVIPLEEQDLVRQVSEGFRDVAEPLDPALAARSMRQWTGMRLVLVDYGVKRNILRSLRSRGVEVEVVPHDSDLETILARRPDAVVLSNGPGDPAQLQPAVAMTRQLIKRVPVLGICLGHQLLGQAAGARTSRLRFGHHGGNHPVLDLRTGRVTMTSQNHEFEVDAESLPASSGFRVSHRNLHDGSVEGLVHDHLPVRSVQFHPEGAPGPQDNQVIFDEFLDLVAGRPAAPITVYEPVRRPASVLVIGSGPIVIGQAAEFDYAGTQACKALREEGITTVLVNSNPATIMTDEDVADRVYLEPLTVDAVERVIQRELAAAGVLDRYHVRLLGAGIDTIRKAEDRQAFKEMLQEIGEPVPVSRVCESVEEVREFAAEAGLRLVIRPAYTLGGTGGGFVTNAAELERIALGGLNASPIHQVLIERSLWGWKEIEYEVMRDAADTCITVCNMENLDPMGVHTGDSIVVAPAQTLSDRDHQMLRSSAIRIIRTLGIEGGCNVQFALDPKSSQYYVIEVNPRVSRSSALASKATGYPIARVAAKVAVGRRLEEIRNEITGRTFAAFEPALDYVVVKVPRWPFDKFPAGDRRLGTQMKSTGEVMALERTFEAALVKAMIAALRGESVEPGAPTYKLVDTCAGEFEAATPYYYSCWEEESESKRVDGRAELVIGSGPIRIGQGIEFDYCSVHAAWALRDAGVRAVLINSNPETVSTDFDTSDRLYFEPLGIDGAAQVAGAEGVAGALVQFGGQTAINLAEPMEQRGIPILGSGVDAIDLAEDRRAFAGALDAIGIPQPVGGTTTTVEEALLIAERAGYPVLVRPSYVLGGRAMEIVHNRRELQRYMTWAISAMPRGTVLVDKYLQGDEVETDAVTDGETVVIPGVMKHVERAGVHSGDSYAIYPAPGLERSALDDIVDYTVRIARHLRLRGLVNVQYVVHRGKVYVLEVNPRASRTVPFLSKVTGEAIGIDRTLVAAMRKAFAASGVHIRPGGAVLLTIADVDKPEIFPIVSRLVQMGCRLVATEGTARALRAAGFSPRLVAKIGEEGPTVLDVITAGEVELVINTMSNIYSDSGEVGGPVFKDGFEIRRAAVERRIPCLTSLDTAAALLEAAATAPVEMEVRTIDEWRQGAAR